MSADLLTTIDVGRITQLQGRRITRLALIEKGRQYLVGAPFRENDTPLHWWVLRANEDQLLQVYPHLDPQQPIDDEGLKNYLVFELPSHAVGFKP